MSKKESSRFTLYGDFDGMTVGELIEVLEQYPESAEIEVSSEQVYGYGGWTEEERDYFIITWNE